MQTLIRIVVALALLLLVLVGVSYLFPGTYRVERAVEINAAAPAVFARVGDLRQWASWTPWHQRDPEMKMTYSEISVGKGAWQKWNGPKSGTGELTVTLHEPPSRMGYDLYFPDFDMRSAGEIVILPAEAGGGVRVVWSDQGALGLNPVNRWFGLFMDKMIGADFEAGLERLRKLSEAPLAQ